MNQNFDFFGLPEMPIFTLCNPDKSELYSLGLLYDSKLTLRYNAIGEFSFTFPKTTDGGITTIEAYSHIKNKKLVLVQGYGYFLITDAVEEIDGSQPVKKVSCKSLEFELISKRISAYGGTVKLYDIITPEGTLLDTFLKSAPNWTVGSIDTSLLIKYRTFNISDSNIYNILAGEVSAAFECIFIFDNMNRTISAVAYENATSTSDIFLSFDNLIDKATLSEKTDEITTCLSVYGGGSLNIRGVNPMGTDKVYDFSYYNNSDWMSSGLSIAINNWQALIIANQTAYADSLALLKTYQADMILLNSALSQYQSEYLSLEGVQKVRIQEGIPYSDITIQMTEKQSQIDSEIILISNKQLQIDATALDLQAINTLVSFDSNFTVPQLLELNNFMFENTYKNENIIQTDSMTLVEIQDAQQELYNQGINILARVSQPRYEISFDAVNYVNLPEFQTFTQQTQLGSVFYVQLSDTQLVETVLLEISMSFHNPENFSMVFSNRLRLDNGNFIYSDLFGNVVKTGSKVSFDNLNWSNWENNYKDDVTKFITSSLNTTTNNLINNNNQEILINQNGLRGRTLNPSTGLFDPTQVWLTSSVLAFTDDSFATSKLALGKISTSAGDKFGLIADVIVGRLLAGNTLTISNDTNNFVLDETGATLNNAKFSINTTNTKVIIDPTSTIAFRIQKNEGGTFNDKFWVDNAGNVNFSGNLSGASGSFSGTITATAGTLGGIGISNAIPITGGGGIYKVSDPANYYIKNNGDLKWGSLSIIGTTATFTGNIQADKLIGAVSYSQLTDIPASKITSGSMSGSRIYGGTLSGSGLSISLGGTGIPTITGSSGVSLYGGISGSLTIGNTTSMSSSNVLIEAFSQLRLYGDSSIYLNCPSLIINGSYGRTVYGLAVSTPSGTRYLYFINGILTSY